MPQAQYGWLFRFSCRIFKYFCFGCYGLGIALLLGTILGAYPIAIGLLLDLAPWLVRGAVGLLLLLFTAILWESIR